MVHLNILRKLLLYIFLISTMNVLSFGQKPVYLDPDQPIDKRVEDLLDRMTLEEKIGQMNMPCVYLQQLGK